MNSSNFDHRKNIHTLFFKDDGVGGGGGGRKKTLSILSGLGCDYTLHISKKVRKLRVGAYSSNNENCTKD